MQANPINRKMIITALILLLLLIFAATLPKMILGNATRLTLASAQPLVGVVSQSMGASGNQPLPVPGKDYKLTTYYFDDNTWAVGFIAPLNNSLNASVVVLQKRQGTFQVVMGPGSAFAKYQVSVLPSDLRAYLSKYVPVFQ